MSADLIGARLGRPAAVAFPVVAINLVGVAAGVAGVIANSFTLWNISTGKRAIIRKIMWFVTAGAGNGELGIGYNDAVNFIPCLPPITLIAGMGGAMVEDEIPRCGNQPDGFVLSTVPLLGNLTGTIEAQCNCAGIVANPVYVQIEVEEI